MKVFYYSTCFECYYIHPQEPATVCRCIALVRCVLVYWCGSAGVGWYPNAGWSTTGTSSWFIIRVRYVTVIIAKNYFYVASVRTIDSTGSHIINASANYLARTEKLSNVHMVKESDHVGELNIQTEKFNIKERHKSFFRNTGCRGILA